MNILFVTGIFAENHRSILGGMAGAVYKLALGMQDLGHHVRILAVAHQDRRWKYHGLEVISVQAENGLHTSNVLSCLCCILNREYILEKTIRILNTEKSIDIIQYTGWFGIGLMHYMKIPAIMRVSSYTKIQLANNYSKKMIWMLSTVERMAAKRMNFLFAPSRLLAKGIEDDIGKKVGVIETPYWEEELEYDDVIYQKTLRSKHYILYFGRLSVDKGILVIKDIVYRILDENPDIYFVFAGSDEGGVAREIKKAAGINRNRIIFVGYLSKEKLKPVIKNADMILMPSLADNFPNGCAEAMALGKIVVGTDGSSLEQFIKDGRNGFLVQIGDAESLYSAVSRVLSLNKSQICFLSKNAKRRIQQLNLRNYSEKMETVYKRVISIGKENNKVLSKKYDGGITK